MKSEAGLATVTDIIQVLGKGKLPKKLSKQSSSVEKWRGKVNKDGGACVFVE